ncbi:hypothetical protein RIF29_08931 [Crotalaria pallida]|uniref:F-box associated beta-propeller type 1 domain-containing protein n=1 Tax=Crotalaria pallida TaxID=3830 RepID=A0AAN9FZ37_CROPI
MPNNFCISNLLMLYDEMFRSKVKLEWPSPFPYNNLISIVGSFVNGMLCLCQGGESGRAPEIGKKIVFWNPTTRDFKVIPPVSIDCPLGVTVSVGIHGFGYDLVTDDYKLIQCFHFVRGWSPQDDGQFIRNHLWQMYSLRSNSWRKIDCEISNRWSFDGVYLNGVCHWWGFKEVFVLVSFNLSDEVFHTTPIYYNDFYDMCRMSMMVLNYSVAMITMHASMTFLDISTLGEVGVKESWTKLFTIGPLPCGIARPIRVWKNGDMLLIRKKDNELVWFHSSTQLVEDLGVKVRQRCQRICC